MSCPTNCVRASWPCTWFTRNWSLMCILLKSPVRSWTVTSVTRPTSLSGVSVGVSPKSCLLNISGARRLYHTFAFHLSLIFRAAARDFFSAIRAARRGVAYLRIDESGRLERRADGFTSEDFTAFFDRAAFDRTADLSNWHAVRRGLRKKLVSIRFADALPRLRE